MRKIDALLSVMELVFFCQYHALNCAIIVLSDGEKEIEGRIEKNDNKWQATLWSLPNDWRLLTVGTRQEAAKAVTQELMKL